MKPSVSKYACKVTLPIKKDGSKRFCGDYHPLNAQMHKDAYPMPFIKDVLSQMGCAELFSTLNLQNNF
jgi:hypothetical protein